MGLLAKLQRLQRTGMIGMAARGAIGAEFSRVGEAIGSERLTYNRWTFDMFHRLAVETAPAIVSGILRRFPDIERVVDLGAGTGAHVAAFEKRGLACTGYEYSALAREIAADRLAVTLRPFDLTEAEPWPGSGPESEEGERYDLALSLEVGEHLPPELGDKLVATCVEAAPHVLFSAAPPGQGGQGHVNEQPKAYWIERFARHGYQLDEAQTEALVTDLRHELVRGMHLARNVMIFSA